MGTVNPGGESEQIERQNGQRRRTTYRMAAYAGEVYNRERTFSCLAPSIRYCGRGIRIVDQQLSRQNCEAIFISLLHMTTYRSALIPTSFGSRLRPFHTTSTRGASGCQLLLGHPGRNQPPSDTILLPLNGCPIHVCSRLVVCLIPPTVPNTCIFIGDGLVTGLRTRRRI
jgi:hypothetical protein